MVTDRGSAIQNVEGSGEFLELEISGDENLENESSDIDPPEILLNEEDEIVTLSDRGRLNFDIIKPEKFIGPQYFVSRPEKSEIDKGLSQAVTDVNNFVSLMSSEMRFPDKIINYGLEKKLSECDCECLDRYHYQHSTGQEGDSVEIVLRDDATRKCDKVRQERCCKSEDSSPGQPRFRFPDQSQKPSEEPPTSNKVTGIEDLLSEDKFTTVHLEDKTENLQIEIGSETSWFVILHLKSDSNVELKLSARSTVGFLARKNQKPKLVDFDILGSLEGVNMIPSVLSLKEGIWYFKLTNEEAYDQEMLLSISLNKSTDDVICCESNNKVIFGTIISMNHQEKCQQGVYTGERGCLCNEGWFGITCNISQAQCSEQHCNTNGHCLLSLDEFGMEQLICQCHDDYNGEDCSKLSCSEDCGVNGVCQEGQCQCFQGWEGLTCNITKAITTETICMDALLAEEATCPTDCGAHSKCIRGQCQCEEGWEGDSCEKRSCDPRCTLHGTCHDGHCQCSQGWYGTHCTLDGCPHACSGHGECVAVDNVSRGSSWRCECVSGWSGLDCGNELEQVCDDGVDNDKGELINYQCPK